MTMLVCQISPKAERETRVCLRWEGLTQLSLVSSWTTLQFGGKPGETLFTRPPICSTVHIIPDMLSDVHTEIYIVLVAEPSYCTAFTFVILNNHCIYRDFICSLTVSNDT